MPERTATDATVDQMPLDELRARARDVHSRLEAAREEVRVAVAAPTAARADACVQRLLATLAHVRALLPGLTLGSSPESKRRMDVAENELRDAPVLDRKLPAPHLSDEEVLRARAILAELREGMERLDLLAQVEGEIDELVEMIERQSLRLGGELALPPPSEER